MRKLGRDKNLSGARLYLYTFIDKWAAVTLLSHEGPPFLVERVYTPDLVEWLNAHAIDIENYNYAALIGQNFFH